jgi:hypothetical protein
MDWTTDFPTTPGWYWFCGDTDDGALCNVPVCVHVEYGDSSLLTSNEWFAWQPHMDYTSPLSEFSGKWAGPIDHPV